MFTRKDYMSGVCTHEQYYAQFVNDSVKKMVTSIFGLTRLKAAIADLNLIPIREWESLTFILEQYGARDVLKQYGDVWSINGGVCILKAAARQVVTENQ